MTAREPEVLVGGQAVMEGVLMKLPRTWAVTIRRSDGSLVTREGSCQPWSDRWPVFKLPIVRGAGVLGQMMALGMRTLWFSSDVAARDAEASTRGDGGAPTAPGGGTAPPSGRSSASNAPTHAARVSQWPTLAQGVRLVPLMLASVLVNAPDGTECDDESRAVTTDPAPAEPSGMPAGHLALSIGLALVAFLVLFKALPLGVAVLAGKAWPVLKTPLGESVVSGLTLAAVFIGYLALMSLIPDIRRVFQYHGAEHCVVHVHEARESATVDNARAKPTLHPRCGTSFLFFMVLTSIVVWAFLPMKVGFLAKLGFRLLAFPLVVGLSYELIRLSARHRTNPFFRALMAPGLWSQRITTRRPDDSMLEVSLSSLGLAASRAGMVQDARGAWALPAAPAAS